MPFEVVFLSLYNIKVCLSAFKLNSLGLYNPVYNLSKCSFQILFHLESYSIIFPLLCTRIFHVWFWQFQFFHLITQVSCIRTQTTYCVLTSQCFLNRLNIANLINFFIHRSTFFFPSAVHYLILQHHLIPVYSLIYIVFHLLSINTSWGDSICLSQSQHIPCNLD